MNFGGVVKLNKSRVLMVVGIVLIFMLGVRHTFYANTAVTEPRLVNLKTLLAAAIESAERGGDKVREIREAATLNEKSKGETLEGANNPVTDGDILSHRQMYYSITKAFPTIEVISEEKDSIDASDISAASKEFDSVSILDDSFISSEDIKVWIDPLDATVEYTENLLQYVTTMVCVAVDGIPTIGVIHKPFEQKTYWSWVGRGSSQNLQMGDNVSSNDVSKIIVSRSHAGDVSKVAKSAFGEQTVITPAGGAGYKTLEVIQGSHDAYVHVTRIKKWDICAGNAILNSLDGKMTTLDGHTIDYSNKDTPLNDGGLVATLKKHDFYLTKLKSLKQ